MNEPENRIDLTGAQVRSPTDTVEIARLWATSRGPGTVFINAGPLAASGSMEHKDPFGRTN
jgi:hypothetical protein